jgi:cyclase
MREVRIIPCLDVKEGRVVKGIKFVNLRDARDPVEAAQTYCREGADELVFLDIFATVENRKTRLEWVKRVADVVKNPTIIKEASQRFSKEKLVVAIDGKKNPAGRSLPRLEVVVKSGTESTGIDIVKWAKHVEELGAGEILLTSKDADGTKEGYDLEMTKAVAEAVSIPVTASGGAGKLEHLYEAITIGKASAVLAASIFHFGEISIPEAKKYLKEKGIEIKI